jgi:hypothetical protein
MVRDPPVPNNMSDMILPGSGLRRHGPIFVVDVPRRSLGYAVVTSPDPRACARVPLWGRGARNAGHCISTTGS